LYRTLGGHQRRSGHGGEEKNSQPLPELEPPIIQPVAQRCTKSLRISYRIIPEKLIAAQFVKKFSF